MNYSTVEYRIDDLYETSVSYVIHVDHFHNLCNSCKAFRTIYGENFSDSQSRRNKGGITDAESNVTPILFMESVKKEIFYEKTLQQILLLGKNVSLT